MATITGLTAQKMLQLAGEEIIDGQVVGDNLILVTRDGIEINAGNVRGATGPTGPAGGVNTYPALTDVSDVAPEVGQISVWDGALYSPKYMPYWRGVLAALGTAQTITSGTPTAVGDFDESNDLLGMHSDTVNPSRFTVPVGMGGMWMVMTNVKWQQATAGIRTAYVRSNGTTTLPFQVQDDADASGSGMEVYQELSFMTSLAAGTYLELMVSHTTGAGLNLLVGTQFAMWFLGALAA